MSQNKSRPEADESKRPEESGPTDQVSSDQEKERKAKEQHQQELLDESIEETFPASDPPTASHVD